MTTEPRRLADINRAAVARLRELRADPDERTAVLRDVADLLVEARAHFFTADGVDWRGRSHAYRRFVQSVYGEAGVERDEIPTLQAAIRYHIGNALRQHLSADEVDRLGLRSESPRERSAEQRQHRTRLLGAIASGQAPESLDEVAETVEILARAIVRIPVGPLASGDAEERRLLADRLATIAQCAGQLEEAARRPRGRSRRAER